MLHVILYCPEIPPNTGNIIRLCANTGAKLHLIEPMAFALDNAKMRRAGLDYHEFAEVKVHADLQACFARLGDSRVFAVETGSSNRYDHIQFRKGDALMFGQETKGLPQSVLDSLPAEQHISLPMRPGNRSLNLSNSVAVTLYEAWRQLNFCQ